MTSMELTEFLDASSPFGIVQCAVALAVPAVLAAIVNLGCGKKREPTRPTSNKSKKELDKSSKAGPGAASAGKSSKSKRSTKSKASKKSSKEGKSSKKSKRSTKSAKKDKSGKSSKSKKSTSSKAKKSKRETKEVAPPKPAQAQPGSTRVAVAAEKRPGSQASVLVTAKAPQENSARSASTQRSVSVKQPGSGAAVDNNNPVVAVVGDSTHELKMEPAELRWSAAGGMQKISLLNQSSERQAIKVKCSDNNVYRVNPVYAFVEPGQTLNVDVMRQNGSNKVDKIVFVTTKAGHHEEHAKNLFKPGTPSAMMVLPLLATAPNNQPTAATVN